MPENGTRRLCGSYLHISNLKKIRTYSLAQFDHWTKEPFSSNFRKMLTLEQYRDPKLAQLHHDYLAEALWSTWRPSSASWQILMRMLCSWRWNSMVQCIFYTVSTTVLKKKNLLLLCWRHILITLLPRLSLITERRGEQHERCGRRKTLGLMPVVRCQDALADTAGDGISNFSSVLSKMQA